jgi:hypothetical protein
MIDQSDELLDFQLNDYINSTFTPELEEDISVAFQLLYAFELPDPEIDFLNLITSDSYLDSNDMQDQFTLILHSKLDYLLSQHKLTLTDTSSLYIKTQILAACYALMYLEDYTHILITLESELSDLEKLSAILSEHSVLSEIDVLTSVTNIDPTFLSTLATYAYSKADEAITTEEELSTEIIENTKLLKQLVNFETLGYLLLKDRVTTNLSLENYINFIGGVETIPNPSLDVYATHIFSILLLTKNNLNGILLTYRKYSHLLVTDPNLTTAVDVKLIELIAKLTDYKKAHNEAVK